MHTLIIGKRVITQLKGDKRFLAMSIIAPLIIIYFLKLLFSAIAPVAPPPMPGFFPMPVMPTISSPKFIMPAIALIVHFLSFVLCAILLVQERTRGTLERMLISGFKKTSIIAGYTIGYFGLATVQAIVVLAEAIWLFELHLDTKTILLLFSVIWMLAIVSVMLGIFISTFARHEGHVFPFIPLIILPSVFLTGVIVSPDKLPRWAEYVGCLLPLRYANNIIETISNGLYKITDVALDFSILAGYAVALLVIASKTLRETE